MPLYGWIILSVYLIGAFLVLGFVLDGPGKSSDMRALEILGLTFFWPVVAAGMLVFGGIPDLAVLTVRKLKRFFGWLAEKRENFKNRPKKVKAPTPVRVSTDNPRGQLEQAVIDRDELNKKIYALEQQVGLKNKYR